MENNDQITSQIEVVEVDATANGLYDEPKFRFSEQEESEQFIRFVEDRATCYSGNKAG